MFVVCEWEEAVKQAIRVPRKQMVSGRDGENHRNAAENSCEAEGISPIIEGRKPPIASDFM